MANKTVPTGASVDDHLASITPERRQHDARALDVLFREATGFQPKMWGPSILGYGRYHYRYKSGREGDFLATGFAPRRSNLVVYIMPGYGDFATILDRLGKFRIGKSCLYINRLSDVDRDALTDLIRAGLSDLANHWPVQPE